MNTYISIFIYKYIYIYVCKHRMLFQKRYKNLFMLITSQGELLWVCSEERKILLYCVGFF